MKTLLHVQVAKGSAVIHEARQYEPDATFECSPEYARSLGALLIVLPPPEAPSSEPTPETQPEA